MGTGGSNSGYSKVALHQGGKIEHLASLIKGMRAQKLKKLQQEGREQANLSSARGLSTSSSLGGAPSDLGSA
jgi:hypothetical protein